MSFDFLFRSFNYFVTNFHIYRLILINYMCSNIILSLIFFFKQKLDINKSQLLVSYIIHQPDDLTQLAVL